MRKIAIGKMDTHRAVLWTTDQPAAAWLAVSAAWASLTVQSWRTVSTGRCPCAGSLRAQTTDVTAMSDAASQARSEHSFQVHERFSVVTSGTAFNRRLDNAFIAQGEQHRLVVSARPTFVGGGRRHMVGGMSVPRRVCWPQRRPPRSRRDTACSSPSPGRRRVAGSATTMDTKADTRPLGVSAHAAGAP